LGTQVTPVEDRQTDRWLDRRTNGEDP